MKNNKTYLWTIRKSKSPIEIEAVMIRQEHRLFSILENYWERKNRFEKTDPRFVAAGSALYWRIAMWLLPGSAAISVGIAGIFGILLQWTANNEFVKQNKYFYEQNAMVKEQTKILKSQNDILVMQIESSERLSRVGNLYETVSKDGESTAPKMSARLRSETLVQFVKNEGRDGRKVDLTGARLQHVSCDYKDLNLSNCDLRFADLYEANLNRVSFNRALLSSAVLRRASLTFADFRHANLYRTKLDEALLQFANFSNATLTNANFKRADISGAIFDGADLTGVIFNDAIVDDKNWLSNTRSKTKNFEGDRYKLVPHAVKGNVPKWIVVETKL